MSFLTEQNKADLLQGFEDGKTDTQIAREAGVPRSTVKDFRERVGQRRACRQQPSAAPAIAASPLQGSLLDVPVRPLSVSIPERKQSEAGFLQTGLLWGDTHFPFQDEGVLSIIRQIAQDFQPDVLLHKGDLLDCYHLSDYDKNPRRQHSIQDEIDQARQHLAHMRLICPDARFVLLEGNHEDRLRRTLWNLQGPAAALHKLHVFQQAMTWPTLLGLEELGIEFLPYDHSQTKAEIFPKWITKHGTLVRGFSAYTARGEQERYGRSGSSGHTHRGGMYFRTDHNGAHCWVETFCTCRLDPEYNPDPNWQQGCVLLTFDRETGAFQAEPIYIRNGLAVWRDHIYRA